MKQTSDTLLTTNLPYPGRRQGKVRDLYELPGDEKSPARLLIVACDRISSFDFILPTPIPEKGRILTDIACRWFEKIQDEGIVPIHLLSTDVSDLISLSARERQRLSGRIMIGKACRVIPIECVVRGYLAGSGWNEYKESQSVCGIELPTGLQQCDALPEPIFTPATKAEVGHDENISFEKACETVGQELMHKLRDLSLRIYRMAADYARERGIIIADTKFEFGLPLKMDGTTEQEPILIDEVLTPDSSRFWPAEEYQPGRDQPSFDKQFVRNYLLGLIEAGKWDKTAPAPGLPDDVVQGTVQRYEKARSLLFP